MYLPINISDNRIHSIYLYEGFNIRHIDDQIGGNKSSEYFF
jgi:hypothetical protein